MSPTFKIMETKEKAEELVLKYLRIDNNTKEWFNKDIAKQCALIAVDELINQCYDYRLIDLGCSHGYWIDVKKEINKL